MKMAGKTAEDKARALAGCISHDLIRQNSRKGAACQIGL